MVALCLLFGGGLVSLGALAPPTSPVRFMKDVLRLLEKNRQTCQRPGEIAGSGRYRGPAKRWLA
jgi:hypothetical protein